MTTRIASIVLAGTLSVALSGCISFGGKAPPILLNLTPDKLAPAGSGGSVPMSQAIAVLEPGADARLGVTRVPVQVDDAHLAYLKDASWVERPTHLFQHLLAETLRAKGAPLVIEGDPGTAGLRVTGRLLDMGYDARTHAVVVRFDGFKERPSGVAETRRFEATVPGVDAKAQPVSSALNEAANKVASEVADWVR